MIECYFFINDRRARRALKNCLIEVLFRLKFLTKFSKCDFFHQKRHKIYFFCLISRKFVRSRDLECNDTNSVNSKRELFDFGLPIKSSSIKMLLFFYNKTH